MIEVTLHRHKKPGHTGYQYDALLDGKILCTSRDPEYTACRVLQGMGIDSPVRFRHDWRGEAGLTLNSVSWGAGLRTEENTNAGPRITKWKPFELKE